MATRKEKRITDICYSFMWVYDKYTPDQLIEIAQKLKENKITSIEFGEEYDSPTVFYYRLETYDEARKREKEYEEMIKNNIAREEYSLKEKAKQFGYKLVKEEGGA